GFLAALPLEVLHYVRDVDGRTIDSCFRERVVEQTAGGSHEGMPGTIFLVAGLLTDEHHTRGHWAFAEHGLRADGPEVASLTPLRRISERARRCTHRKKLRGRVGRNRKLETRHLTLASELAVLLSLIVLLPALGAAMMS